ncbi:hypothetical protein B7992_03490 [Fibrobacter sp. UWH1]|nr:hypothetical protein B7992_03490 [Fibrobacter sp. UWH1]
MAVSTLAFLGLLGLNACSDDGSSSTGAENGEETIVSSESSDEKPASSDVAKNSSSSSVGNQQKKSSSSAKEESPKSSAKEIESSVSETENAKSSAEEQSSSSAEVKESSSSSTPAVEHSPAFKEDFRSECTIGEIPTSLKNAKLPDPFKTLAGTRISTKAEWKCRREEIGAMYEKIMYGDKPRNPEKVEGKLAGSTFYVTVSDKGNTASFAVVIDNAGTKDNPKPAMIGFGGGFMGNTCGSLGESLDGLDIAQIIFNPDNVAPESNRGSGKFYDIYGSNASAGTIMAWAWGVSRLIDALEKYPEAGIDVKRLGITGCSRWGKGALAVGAFDTRIALTIPQESGSGGASLWRVGAQVNKQKGKQFVQGLNSAGSEGNWMKTTFKNYDGRENTLPFDQHMLVAMVAPRPLLIIDNAGQEWLGEVPSNYCGQASKEVYDALGASDNYTYSQEGGHAHCALPNGQFDEVKDFINKFLVGKEGIKTGKIDYTKNSELIKWNKSEWIDWETPDLN